MNAVKFAEDAKGKDDGISGFIISKIKNKKKWYLWVLVLNTTTFLVEADCCFEKITQVSLVFC